MAENETTTSLPDPHEGQSPKEALEAGKLFDLVRDNPEEAAKLGIGVAGMRREPLPEPEPLSKSIQGPLELSHVMDAIGRTEEQNRQILEILRNHNAGVF